MNRRHFLLSSIAALAVMPFLAAGGAPRMVRTTSSTGKTFPARRSFDPDIKIKWTRPNEAIADEAAGVQTVSWSAYVNGNKYGNFWVVDEMVRPNSVAAAEIEDMVLRDAHASIAKLVA